MKKVAFILNSPQLGGAERSLIHQAQLITSQENTYFFIPSINKKDNSLELFLRENNYKNVISFNFPKTLYHFSRSGILSFISLVKLPFSLLRGLISLRSQNFYQYDILWCNGNKVGLFFFLWAIIFRFQGQLIWHFRDYPHSGFPYGLIWKLLGKSLGIRVKLVANSLSVANAVEKLTRKKTFVCYNPSGIKRSGTKPLKEKMNIIGLASMLAPWKGIHNVLHFVKLYESDLKDLGIEEVAVFGSNIYLTDGEHDSYDAQLRKFIKKTNCSLIKFYGNQKPEDIFERIDLLLHSSLQPEPFGRIITEAFSNNVPVISTGLGGAGELVENKKTGLLYIPYDYQGLYSCIKMITSDQNLREKIIQDAFKRSCEVEKNIKDSLQKVLTS